MSVPNLSPYPTRNMTAQELVDATQLWMASLQPWQQGLETLAASMSMIAAGGAFALPYNFSTTTTDADPGNGFLRLNNATQNASTIIRMDLTTSDGLLRTGTLDSFDDSSSFIKGWLRISKLTDPSKFLLFSITGTVAAPTGYRNITIAGWDGSSASPFANNDALVVTFQRNGDKGDTGLAGGMTLLASVTPTAAAAVNFLNVFTGYDNYLILGRGILPSSNDYLTFQFANGGALDGSNNYFRMAENAITVNNSPVASGLVHGSAAALAASGKGINFSMMVQAATATSMMQNASCDAVTHQSTGYSHNQSTSAYTGGAISGIGFKWNGANNFVAQGQIKIYGLP